MYQKSPKSLSILGACLTLSEVECVTRVLRREVCPQNSVSAECVLRRVVALQSRASTEEATGYSAEHRHVEEGERGS